MPWWKPRCTAASSGSRDGRHLLAHEDVAGEVEAELGRDPGQREQEQQHGEHEPEPVAARAPGEGDAVAAHRGHGQPEREQRRRAPAATLIQRASRSAWSTTPGTAVTAQSAIDDPDEQPRPAGDRRERDRGECERVVEEDERAAEAGGDVARFVDVVERLGRQARVGDECRGRLEPDQGPR